MSGPSDLAVAIEGVEERVRRGEPLAHATLADAFDVLGRLQDDPRSDRLVVEAARHAQHWLSQYVAASIDGATGLPQPDREATLRRMTLEACVDLRIAITRAWCNPAPRPNGAAVRPPLVREESKPGAAVTVLLVEDDPDVRRMAAHALESAGYAVVATGRPDEAIDIAQRADPLDALVIDVVLPQMSGIATASHIRRSRPYLPILFMSGYPVAAVAGTTDFIAKPFAAPQLVAALDTVIERAAPAA